MQRLLVTYRWELWLLGGIPLVSGIVVPLLPSVLPILPRGDWLFDRYTYFRIGTVDHLATVALLAVSYSRVRRSGRNLLPLVWGCALVTVAVGELLWFTVTAVAPVFETSAAFSLRLWQFGLSLANFIVSLPVLLWFAWQALRFSLAHAFFLFLIVKAYPLPIALPIVTESTLANLLSWVSLSLSVAMVILLVWLLGDFESRGAAFRRRAVAVWLVFVVGILVALLNSIFSPATSGTETLAARGLIIGILTLIRVVVFPILPLALIYLMWMRRPALEAEPADASAE